MGQTAMVFREKEWTEVMTKMTELVAPTEFERWFSPTRFKASGEEGLIVEVPNAIHEFWIESNYGDLLKKLITDVAGSEMSLSFAHPDEAAASTEKSPEASQAKKAAKKKRVEDKLAKGGDLKKRIIAAGLNPQYSFDTFVVGDHCEYATATALAAAKKPGRIYNPLFIHGDTGLGKTHLMQAIGQEVLRKRPNAKVVYVSSEDFTNEFIENVRDGNLKKLRARYRKADVLLIDDIQFLQDKDSTQDEFFHTFNTLYNANKQIVLTSDLPPAQLTRLEGRLVSRCEWGVSTQLLPPNVETRVAILRHKMEAWKEKLDDSVLFYLAERIRTNVRRLEGALLRLGSLAALGKDRIDETSMEHLLKDILEKEASSTITIDRIQRKVSKHYDIRLADMMSKRRPANIALPRQIAMFLSRELTRSSLKDIGEAFGGRDHGTVIHACKRISELMTKDEKFRHEVGSIRSHLERV